MTLLLPVAPLTGQWNARRVNAMRAQGWYYLLGGVWPLVHFPSFVRVAGPNPERFQTEVASVLFAAVGAALLAGGEVPTRATRTLSTMTAIGVAALDWRYRAQLRAIFRVEAALEMAFATSTLRRPPPHASGRISTAGRGRRPRRPGGSRPRGG